MIRRAGALSFTLLACMAAPAAFLHAQSARDSLMRGGESYDLAEYDAAVRSLSFGLNPGAGPRDSLWVASVHKLVHGLMQSGHGPQAVTWGRWAIRHMPRLQVNDVDFPPAVVAVLDTARAYVKASSGDDTVAVTTWRWTRPSAGADGSLWLVASEVPIRVNVEGVGPVAAGQPQALRSGTYRITASADGYRSATLSREILPGVATVLEFFLRSLNPASPGFIYIAAVPWGSVLLDGQLVGPTPVAARRVEPGIHRLRIERPGFVPYDTIIKVATNQRLRLGTIGLGRSAVTR